MGTHARNGRSRSVRFFRYGAVAVAVALPGGMVMGSCGYVLDTFEKYDSEANADGGTDAEPLCVKLSYPPFPVIDAGADADADAPPPPPDIDFVAAVRMVELGEREVENGPVGINLDQTCTCITEGPSCIYPVWANKDHCDDKQGVDNAASRVFKSIAAALGASGFGSGFYSKMAEEGEWSLLVRVQGYNGQLDDPNVKFSLYTTPGYLGGGGAGGAGGAGGMGGMGGAGGVAPEAYPSWDGNDAWHVSSDSLLDGASIDMPKYFDDKAYVSQGTLVANLTDSVINFAGQDSTLSIKLTAGTFLGSIQNPQTDVKGWRIVNGTVSGRWKMSDLFDNLGTFTANGMSFCNDKGFIYTKFKETVCGFADIASTLGGPTLECDSLSFGMLVQTFPAKLGPLFTPPPVVSTCPEGQNPADDACGM